MRGQCYEGTVLRGDSITMMGSLTMREHHRYGGITMMGQHYEGTEGGLRVPTQSLKVDGSAQRSQLRAEPTCNTMLDG